VPLTPYQTDIARLFSHNRTPDSYLAGGAAINIEPNSKRFSNDLAYFHDSEERVASAFAEDRASLEGAGYVLTVSMRQPGYIRAVVEQAGQQTKIEWAHDSAWRFLPPVRSELAGYQLHPIDLAINKLLALVGRDEARDFLDTLAIHEQVLPLGAQCWAAAGKDPGFTPLSILSLLQRRGKYQKEDFSRLSLREPVDLPALKSIWLAALAEADAFVRARPPEEMGCLYYARSRRTFVGRFEAADVGKDVVPHYGRPGGVLPRIS
jgi:hypothetical protein